LPAGAFPEAIFRTLDAVPPEYFVNTLSPTTIPSRFTFSAAFRLTDPFLPFTVRVPAFSSIALTIPVIWRLFAPFPVTAFPAGSAVVSAPADFPETATCACFSDFTGAAVDPADATVASDTANTTAMPTENSCFIFPTLLSGVVGKSLRGEFKDYAGH